jgi:hypothetical protein
MPSISVEILGSHHSFKGSTVCDIFVKGDISLRIRAQTIDRRYLKVELLALSACCQQGDGSAILKFLERNSSARADMVRFKCTYSDIADLADK